MPGTRTNFLAKPVQCTARGSHTSSFQWERSAAAATPTARRPSHTSLETKVARFAPLEHGKYWYYWSWGTARGWWLITLFPSVVFGHFNTKNTKRTQKWLAILILKTEVYLRRHGDERCHRWTLGAESQLGAGMFQVQRFGPRPWPPLRICLLAPSLATPSCWNLHGPHDTFTAAFRVRTCSFKMPFFFHISCLPPPPIPPPLGENKRKQNKQKGPY